MCRMNPQGVAVGPTFFGYFLWRDKDQFAGSELEQPQAGPEGEVQGWTS